MHRGDSKDFSPSNAWNDSKTAVLRQLPWSSAKSANHILAGDECDALVAEDEGAGIEDRELDFGRNRIERNEPRVD